MAKQPFKRPNNARIAFVLGIAFEAWDRNKPSRGGALQSPLPANALCKRDYSTETFREFGGKIGVMVELSGASTAPEVVAAAKDVAMQIAAASPLAVGREEVDPEAVAKEKAIFEAQARESGKPEKIIEKMVTGRLEKFYKEVCLLQQGFVKNPDQTVAQYLKEVGGRLGKDLQVKRFTRYQVGTD